MGNKKSGKTLTEAAIDKAIDETPKHKVALPGTVIKDFGVYRVEVVESGVEEMKGRIVYAVINNDTGVTEEECSVLPQALLHAGQFNKEMVNDAWEKRLNPSGMMVPTGPQVVPRSH